MAGGPLEGVTIVDLTSVVVGPLCTQILADHGAEVIKVEGPKGDLVRNLNGKSPTPGMGAKFLHLNRNKRSVVLDLKQPAGLRSAEEADRARRRARVERAARGDGEAQARVRGRARDQSENHLLRHVRFRPGRTLSQQACVRFGSSRARAAWRDCSKGPAAGPRNVPLVAADKTVGLIAVQMIVMALYRRTQTGEGCAIEIPMFENFVKFVMEEHMYLKTFDPPLGGTCDPRLIDAHAGPIPTKDGYICISATTNAQAFALFDAIGRPELKEDPRFNTVQARFANVKDYYASRVEAMKAKTTAEWLEIFDKADIPAMPYHTPDSVLDDPHLKDVGFFEWRQHPTEGKVRMMRLPNKWSCGTRKDWNPAPKLGQQSVEVLKEIGLDDGEIDAMVRSGATVDGRLNN